MRILAILFCIFLSHGAFAQNKDTTNKQVKQPFFIKDMRSISNVKDPIYIVDGKAGISKHKLTKLDPNNVLNIDILKGNDADGHPVRPTILVTTRQYAITAYLKNLSNFSPEFKNYLKENHDNDATVIYLINGIALEERGDDRTKALNKLSGIKTVDFIKKYSIDLNNETPLVIIATTIQN